MHMYLTAAECAARVALLLLPNDRRRQAFLALDAAGQAVCIRQASADIDQQVWVGFLADADQPGQWPRVWSRSSMRAYGGVDGASTGRYVDPDPAPPEVQAPDVSNIPARLRDAVTHQAAFIAERGAGLNATRHIDEAANRGVASQSGGGQSESIDLERAGRAWHRLCREAQTAMARYRAVAVEVA